MIFTVSTRHYMGDRATIVAMDEQGQEIPVLHIMDGEVGFPGSVEQLAANIASMLNGNQPLYRIDVGNNRLFWKMNANGAELRLQENGQGVSKTGPVLGGNVRASRAALEALFGRLHDHDAMAALMAAMNGPGGAHRPEIRPGAAP